MAAAPIPAPSGPRGASRGRGAAARATAQRLRVVQPHRAHGRLPVARLRRVSHRAAPLPRRRARGRPQPLLRHRGLRLARHAAGPLLLRGRAAGGGARRRRPGGGRPAARGVPGAAPAGAGAGRSGAAGARGALDPARGSGLRTQDLRLPAGNGRGGGRRSHRAPQLGPQPEALPPPVAQLRRFRQGHRQFLLSQGAAAQHPGRRRDHHPEADGQGSGPVQPAPARTRFFRFRHPPGRGGTGAQPAGARGAGIAGALEEVYRTPGAGDPMGRRRGRGGVRDRGAFQPRKARSGPPRARGTGPFPCDRPIPLAPLSGSSRPRPASGRGGRRPRR